MTIYFDPSGPPRVLQRVRVAPAPEPEQTVADEPEPEQGLDGADLDALAASLDLGGDSSAE